MNRLAFSAQHSRVLPPGVSDRRRGAISMILVIAVLIIGTLLLTESVRTVLNERRAVPRQFERRQAEQILQAGLQKLQQLDSIDDVQPGTWSFAKGVIHPDQTGSLQIKVSPAIASAAEQPALKEEPDEKDGTNSMPVAVTITARYPLEADAAVSVSAILTKKDWKE